MKILIQIFFHESVSFFSVIKCDMLNSWYHAEFVDPGSVLKVFCVFSLLWTVYVCVVYFNAVCVDVQLCIAVVTVSLSLENELKKGQIRGVGLSYYPHTHTHIHTQSLIEVFI